jgi:ribosomal protein S27AE
VSPWVALAAAAVVAWLWFLVLGKASGAAKRIAFRITLLGLLAGLLAAAMARGVFTRASAGFQVLLIAALIAVELGYLYTTRFCPRCGRMVRNLKVATCPRCGSLLPRHGMTTKLRAAERREGDGGFDPAARLRRP